MNSFLTKVVSDVFAKNNSFDKSIFVLPSQRACVFLKQEILSKITKAAFLPKIVSIESYIQEISELNLIDTTQLLFEFYSIYSELTPLEKREPFESFSQWATIVLHDFNEIDNYLVDSNSIFETLKEVKKLNEWFQDKKPSQLAINYLHFFESLQSLYTALQNQLKKHKVGYQGMLYKQSIQNLSKYCQKHQKHQIVFAGFNALNNAEEIIIQELLSQRIATVYWDADEHILNPKNSAGFFLRKYKNGWEYYKNEPFLWVHNDKNTKNYQIIGAPKNNTQIKYAGEIISGIENFQKTAFILADENLLGLALNSLPANVKNINITMGYPLKDIPVANLFENLFRLYLNQQKLKKEENHQFYYKDVLNVFNNAFLNKINGDLLQKLVRQIKSENNIFLTVKSIKKMLSNSETEKLSYLFSLFEFTNNMNEIIQQCIFIIQFLKDDVEGVEKEYLYRFYNVFQQLQSLNLHYNHITDLKTLAAFYNQLLKNEKLSFQGEPLQGLQLMGMLETRALDFDTVIMTSVNEGILPAGKNENSFIPFDVKKHFGLPTYQEKDAIFSYHFQRLLMRTKKCFLIYNTETDGYGSGEKSRFLTQLLIDNPTCKPLVVSPKMQQNEQEINRIEKSEEVLEKLKEVFIKGISPSALATYIYNPIQFYEQKVLKIKEENELEETIAANTMGSVIHDVLEEMYKPFIGKFLNKEAVNGMKIQCDSLLIKYFEKHYLNGNLSIGKNRLIFEVSKNHIHRFLRKELNLLNSNKKLKIIALEENLKTKITIDGIDFPITLNGFVDRIDELDGITRIIDYKTGKVEAKNLKLIDFEVISEDYKYTKAMQVLLYSYLYLTCFKPAKYQLQSGIISFKNLNSGFLKVNFSDKFRGVDNDVTEDRIATFMDEIKILIKEILNPKIPFIENENLPF